MLIKSRKGQVLKKINLNNSFVVSEDGNFIVPVEMSTSSSSFFNVKKILVAFTPVTFTDAVKKPFHIKSNLDNKKSYKNNDIIDEKNSDIFKSIYSKNIVNSKDQINFEGNVFNVNIPVSEDDFFEVVTSTELQDVIDLTKKTTRMISPSTGEVINEQQEFSDFFVRVYALNDKNEVIDNIEVRSQNIQSYIEEESELSRKRKLNVLSSRLNEALDGFSLNLKKFTFTSESSNERITISENTGTEIVINEQVVREIVENGEREGLNIDLNFCLLDNLESNDFLELISIESSSFQVNSDLGLSPINISKRNFKLNCLTNENYINMVTKLYNKCINENLNSVKVYYKVIFNSSSILGGIRNGNLEINKEEFFSIEILTQAYEDIQQFNFVNDIKNKKVINVELTKDTNRTNFLNKLSLTFNSLLHKKEKLFKNSISFDFIVDDPSDLLGQRNKIIEEFYFDKNLTSGNTVIVNSSNKIENYIDNSNSVDLYFSLDAISIKEVFVNFYNNFEISSNPEQERIRVGPFGVDRQSLTNDFRQDTSEFRLLENKLKEKIQIIPQENLSNKDIMFGLIRGESIEQLISLNLKDFVGDNLQNIQKLDFFPDELPSTLNNVLGSEDSRSEVLGSILVKIEKTMFVNKEILFNINHYCFLSDIPSSSESSSSQTKILYNIKSNGSTTGLVNLDIFNEDSTNRRDLNFVISNNFRSLSRFFECRYRTTLEAILLNQKTTKCLGSPEEKSLEEINESKNKLVEIIFNLNPSYNASDLSNVLNLGYSSSFNANRRDFVKKVFDITNLSSSPGKSLQEISVSKEDLL